MPKPCRLIFFSFRRPFRSDLLLHSTMASSTSNLLIVLRSSEVRWAISGWAFFISENAILSENRTFLIEQLGDDNYHLVYGSFSTAAMASIAYSYFRLTRTSGSNLPILWKTAVPLRNLAASWTCMSLGLIMASQALPKMQIPFMIAQTTPSSSSYKFQVRCPFDFSDKDTIDIEHVRGLERITRHPGLWSLGLVGMGNAFLQSTIPLRIWWFGPASIAWLGGMHSDSRFRRGMGGTLDPYYESQTSNLPFVAMVTGKQGSCTFGELVKEIKPLNAAVATAVATLWVVSRGRVRLQ